jgi:hypothetical protein
MLIQNLNALRDPISSVDINNSFHYNINFWITGCPDYLLPMLTEINNNFSETISRNQILEFAANMEAIEQNDQNCLKLFMLSLIWGSGLTNRNRTKIYGNEPSNIIDSMKAAVRKINENDFRNALKNLLKIEGLGISFATKIMYFYGKANRGEMTRYPLILDNRVITSLIRLSMTSSDFEKLKSISSFSPKSNAKSYLKYLELIFSEAENKRIDADKYEYFLYWKKGDFVGFNIE